MSERWDWWQKERRRQRANGRERCESESSKLVLESGRRSVVNKSSANADRGSRKEGCESNGFLAWCLVSGVWCMVCDFCLKRLSLGPIQTVG